MSLSTRIQIGIIVLLSTLVAEKLLADDALAFSIDLTQWTLAHKYAGEDARVMEFVRPGDNIKNWSELCTLQQIRRVPGIQISPQEVAQTFRDSLSERVDIAHWQVLAADDRSITVLWSVQGDPKHADQHEIMRYIIGEATLYRVAFTKKARSLSDEQRQQWLVSLQEANLL